MEQTESTGFSKRAVMAVGLGTAAVLLALVLWYAIHGLLLIFVSVLVAVFLRAIAAWIGQVLKLSQGWSLMIAMVLILGVIAGAALLMAPPLADQFDELTKTLPRSLKALQARLDRYEWARGLLARTDTAAEIAENTGVVNKAPQFLSTVVGLLGTILVVLVMGLYFAANPGLYLKGMVRLAPVRKRERLTVVLEESGYRLRDWLIAQLIAMASAGVMTFIAMTLLDVPLALILGLLAGLLEFIPNFGPVIAFVPGVLLALAQGPTQALYVLLAYLGIQLFQSNVIQPVVQQRAADLPAALNIGVLLIMGMLLGMMGLLVATPLLCVAMVLIRRLYIEDVLGDKEPPRPIGDS